MIGLIDIVILRLEENVFAEKKPRNKAEKSEKNLPVLCLVDSHTRSSHGSESSLDSRRVTKAREEPKGDENVEENK